MKSIEHPTCRCRYAATAVAVALLVLATGCASLIPSPTEPPPAEPELTLVEAAAAAETVEPVPPQPSLTPAEQAEVEDLLIRADRAIAEDHLTYPAAGSALALYDRVRILDPDNEIARRGLERIVERYLELAMAALDQRRFDQARAMMDRARLVDPDHPGVAPTQARIDLLDRADRQVVRLDPQQLSDRNPRIAELVRQAGAASRTKGCRAEITARSDAEGRWIYQQMSSPGSPRIQARLDIGSPPRIEVLCFQ